MGIDHRQVQFRIGDLSEVIEELDQIAERSNGREWITISPWVDPEHLPVVSMLKRMFSGRGPQVPEATWVPANGNEPAQLGFVHATGSKAFERLVDGGVSVPSRFVKVSDHSKRGLLFGVHPDTTAEEVIRFATDASALFTSAPTDDRWIAQVSVGR